MRGVESPESYWAGLHLVRPRQPPVGAYTEDDRIESGNVGSQFVVPRVADPDDHNVVAMAAVVWHVPKLISELFDDDTVVGGEDGADHIGE